jgi:two-component system, sensor histidine kinase and response regulator
VGSPERAVKPCARSDLPAVSAIRHAPSTVVVDARNNSASIHRPVVLVADDSDDNRTVARTVLEGEGYRVVLACGGAHAITAFEAEEPDCILLDVRMPDLDGFAVCEHIRTLPRGGETPIIFLTALRDVDTFDRALRSGGDDFLTKPVQSAELVIRVQSALKLRRMSVELREHYELLKHQRDALLRVQLQKEQLMAFVVHDLKNPVNAMDLHAQVLLRNNDLPPALRESATHIRTEARHLTRMILNLLDLSKGHEGRLSPSMSSVDLRLLAAEVVTELAVTAQSRDVKLDWEMDAGPIRADEDLLRRALTNLVENALRHAPPGSVVTLTAATHDGGTHLRVADAGAGIPPELREMIFDPFVQLEGGSDRPLPTRSGRGLGLAFCKLVARAHGGWIWVEDAAPGAVFCMRLPHEA